MNTFKNVSKLTNLYLSGNHIEFIHPKAFNGLFNLQQLELQNNALSFLNGSVFRFFSSELKEIKLFNNPWFCDCNLRWLLEWLKNNSESEIQRLRWKFHTDEPICDGPSIIKQRSFSTLTGGWFICPIRMYSKARNIETPKGGEVELFCKYMSDPYVEFKGFLMQKHPPDFSPYSDDNGFIIPSYSVGQIMPHRASTLPHNGYIAHDQIYIPHRTRTLPRGYSPHHSADYGSTPVVRSNSVSANHKSASVGHLGIISPPKKPPRSFNSRETVSLHSQSSYGDKENGFRLSLPKPGTVDRYGTAV
ncbi:SLIT and NTRK-like protein 6 [Ruditapes philippinarum]|uniref:SLIT and NTRK-like protein 6 n=1 Tax=Ruditapes philippinarum TaxID=129788 RepID=UPI00295BA91D|nr:SLIT and NTRK-like protein 6 [Ruditapes philippinarum]